VLRIKEGLENRANCVIAASATVATLLFAFGAFLYTDIMSGYQYYWIVFPLGISVGASIAAMIFGIIASRVAKYALPIGDQVFFKANGLKNTEVLDSYRESTEIIFFNTIIDAYLDSIRANTIQNPSKANRIAIAQFLFLTSLLAVLFLLVFLLYAIGTGMVKPEFGLPV
jgi:hypothetical protein